MKVSDDTIERICRERVRKWLRDAAGEAEFYSDGLKINTTQGWREMRLNLLQKR